MTRKYEVSQVTGKKRKIRTHYLVRATNKKGETIQGTSNYSIYGYKEQKQVRKELYKDMRKQHIWYKVNVYDVDDHKTIKGNWPKK